MIVTTRRHGRTRRDIRNLIKHLDKQVGQTSRVVAVGNVPLRNADDTMAYMETLRDASRATVSCHHISISPWNRLTDEQRDEAIRRILAAMDAEDHAFVVWRHSGNRPRHGVRSLVPRPTSTMTTPCKPSSSSFRKTDGSASPLLSENGRRRACGSGGTLAGESSMRFLAIIPEAERFPESSRGGHQGAERDDAAFRRVEWRGAFSAWAITPATRARALSGRANAKFYFVRRQNGSESDQSAEIASCPSRYASWYRNRHVDDDRARIWIPIVSAMECSRRLITPGR